MNYLSLRVLHYTNPEQEARIYDERFHAPFTRHLPIDLQQFNRRSTYPAFLCYPEEMLSLMQKIYHQHERFLLEIHSVPAVVLQQFELLSIVDEVQATNLIEGVHSTRHEIKTILEGASTRKSRFSSVVNKYRGLLSKNRISFASCQDIRDFYNEFTYEEVLMEDSSNQLDGIVFRKHAVDVTSSSGKVIHRGAYPEKEIVRCMDSALQILHDDVLPVLVRVSLFHYLFAYIHPFYDGNGRTDRFITSYYLREYFHPLAALRLSITIKKHRKTYYDLFEETESEVNRGDLTPFVLGFMQLILDSLEDATQLIIRKKRQLAKYERILETMPVHDELLKKIYIILLQAALFFGQGVTIQDIMTMTHKARGTVQKRLDSIPPNQLIKASNNAIYYKLNMMMFKDDDAL